MPDPFIDVSLTPVAPDGSGHLVKREDLAMKLGPGSPSGAKCRVYARMIAAHPPEAILVVGCSATSLMQVYVAAMARAYGREGHVFVSARATESPETRYARECGAIIHPVRPGYLSVCRARAKAWAIADGRPVVRWDRRLATVDSGLQTHNVPRDVTRIVVPVGSGAVMAGIISGLAIRGRSHVHVSGVAVSGMATLSGVFDMARVFTGNSPLPPATLRLHGSAYDRPERVEVAGIGALDPGYAAKAWGHMTPGDLFWNTGRRPMGATDV